MLLYWCQGNITGEPWKWNCRDGRKEIGERCAIYFPGMQDKMPLHDNVLHRPLSYTCQLSRLRHESHACGLKTSISCRLTLAGQFLTPDWKMWVVAVLLDTISKKYVNSDPCKEGKPCVKWINGNTFLAISDFWSEKHWERARVYTRPKTGIR